MDEALDAHKMQPPGVLVGLMTVPNCHTSLSDSIPAALTSARLQARVDEALEAHKVQPPGVLAGLMTMPHVNKQLRYPISSSHCLHICRLVWMRLWKRTRCSRQACWRG